MKTTYVTLKQAKELKKLKIDFDVIITEGNAKAYGKDGSDVNWTTKLFHCWKPTLDFACKWLRENYDIHITPNATYNAYGVIYICTVFYIHKKKIHNVLLKDRPLAIDYTPPKIFDTYEQSQSAGFDYAIKLISDSKIKKISAKDKEIRLKKIEKEKNEYKKVLNESLKKSKNIVVKNKKLHHEIPKGKK